MDEGDFFGHNFFHQRQNCLGRADALRDAFHGRLFQREIAVFSGAEIHNGAEIHDFLALQNHRQWHFPVSRDVSGTRGNPRYRQHRGRRLGSGNRRRGRGFLDVDFGIAEFVYIFCVGHAGTDIQTKGSVVWRIPGRSGILYPSLYDA